LAAETSRGSGVCVEDGKVVGDLIRELTDVGDEGSGRIPKGTAAVGHAGWLWSPRAAALWRPRSSSEARNRKMSSMGTSGSSSPESRCREAVGFRPVAEESFGRLGFTMDGDIPVMPQL
jgi:hypothetical protein